MQAWAYYTHQEKRKRGVDAENFDIVACDNVETVLKRTSKMFKMWHAKQGSGFCSVRYWRSKWGKDGESSRLSCRRWNETADHLNRYHNESRGKVFMDHIALIEQWMEGT